MSELEEKLAVKTCSTEEGVSSSDSGVKSPLRAIVHQDEEAMSSQLQEAEVRNLYCLPS